MRSLVLVLVLGLPALAGDDTRSVPPTAPASYLDVISVGCAPPSNGNLVYVWHTQIPGIDDVKTMRMFKYLQSPKFEGCLSAIAKTKPGLHEALLAIRPDAYPETAGATLQRAREAWIEFGADRALQEVADTGALGPETERFFDRCAGLSKDIGGSYVAGSSVALLINPELYIEIVDVAGGQPESAQLTFVWREHAPGLYDTTVSQAVRTLKSPRFEGCLSAITRTRAGLYEALLDLTPTTYPDTRNALLRRARGVWLEYGAHLALEEAAEKGTAGPDTRAFFDRCDALLQGSSRNKI